MLRNAFIILLALPALAGCDTAQSLTCPAPALDANQHIASGSDTVFKSLRARFQDGASQNELNEAAAAVRQKFPDASRDDVYNYLIAAYCPSIADSNLDIQAKRDKLHHFEDSLRTVLGV